ncbi:MAG: M3 family oligoendopeptidase [Lachnospiraceae bacterium]|nr:M3 family oligoendopeptidase [Lachnospiraceae bacterium]
MKFQDMPYERVSDKEAEKEIQDIIEKSKAAASGEEQFQVHQKYYEWSKELDTMMALAQIRHDVDTTDEFYSKEKDYYDEIRPKLTKWIVEYRKLLYHSPYRSFLEEKIGRVAFKNIELELKSFDEKLIPLMQEENALTTRYDKLIAGARIEWEGEELNLSLLRPYLIHYDRGVRRKAYEKYSQFFSSVAGELDELFDQLVKNRTKQARLLGYENFIELGYYRMKRNCYNQDMVEHYRKQVKKYFVPFTVKLHERRRKRLGLEKLSFIDEGVYFPKGNPTPCGTPEEIVKAGQKMYAEMSPETKEFFDFMMENQLFDVLGRKTKKAGGYMTSLPKYGSPFIFANFNGTSGDVDVMTHECGHAFQGFLSGQNPIQEHWDLTMETAEIHSMSMEFFTEKWMELFFGERAEDYRRMHMESAAAFIPYGCMVDEFQHIIYASPEMTPEERKRQWMKLEKEYRPHMDYEEDSFFSQGGFWQKQLHIYDYPFYYIDYCLAQTCAFQYKTWMDKDRQGAWESYLKLCRLSASDFFTNMLKEVGLESPFMDGCIKSLADSLEKALESNP